MGITTLHAMNFEQVIAQGIGPCGVDFLELGTLGHSGEIFGIASSLDVFGQQEEFLSVTHRNCRSITPEYSGIHRTHMPRQLVETRIVPQQHPGSVGHVLMAEWTGANRVQNGACLFSAVFIDDPQGFSVSIALSVLAGTPE